jgi:hypothetical protein
MGRPLSFNTVSAIGGGFGGLAYHLLRRPRSFAYLDYDIPLTTILAAYFLLSTVPEKRWPCLARSRTWLTR